MRLYLNDKESDMVIGLLATQAQTSKQAKDVLERMKNCKVLQVKYKRKEDKPNEQ